MTTKMTLCVLLAIALMLAAASVAMGQTATKPAKVEFTSADREMIQNYYKHLLGTLAPASIDRKGFPPDVEKGIASGNKLPGQLEKQLQRLPKELEDKLSLPQAGYLRYKLGHHVLMVRRSDLMIADIIKNAGWK
jgi:hypothetical protein